MSSAYASQTRRPAPAYTRRQYVRLARIILMIHDGLRDSPMMRRIYKINLVDGSGTNRAPVAALIDHAVSSQTGPSLSSLEDDEVRRLLLSPFPTICLFNGNISTVGGVGFVLRFQSLPEESDVIWIPTALADQVEASVDIFQYHGNQSPSVYYPALLFLSTIYHELSHVISARRHAGHLTPENKQYLKTMGHYEQTGSGESGYIAEAILWGDVINPITNAYNPNLIDKLVLISDTSSTVPDYDIIDPKAFLDMFRNGNGVFDPSYKRQPSMFNFLRYRPGANLNAIDFTTPSMSIDFMSDRFKRFKTGLCISGKCHREWHAQYSHMN